MRFARAAVAGVHAGTLVVAEVGKLAVGRGRDTRPALFRELSRLAAARGANVAPAVASPLTHRSVHDAGLDFARFPAAALRRDVPELARYFLRYHDYFLPVVRKLGLDIDPDRVATADGVVLDMLLSDVEDGPKLWWCPVDRLACPPPDSP